MNKSSRTLRGTKSFDREILMHGVIPFASNSIPPTLNAEMRIPHSTRFTSKQNVVSSIAPFLQIL